jgi:uncharacterized membrane protein (UPF0127 family)
MVLKKITYYADGKRMDIEAKVLKSVWSKGIGLMFQKKSPALLFVCKRTQWILITSYFCKPFRAIWLDEKMQSTKIIDVRNWKFNISGRGKYLLEIPLPLKNNKLSTTKKFINNRN